MFDALKRAVPFKLWFALLLGSLSLGCPEFSAVMATPTDHLAPAIAREARREIRIAVSVRPTMRVLQVPAASKGSDFLFCVWSNSSTGRYDVGIALEGSKMPVAGRVMPVLQWRGSGPVAGNDGLLWIRDQRASGGDPACSTRESFLTAMATSNGKRGDPPASGLLTILVSPH